MCDPIASRRAPSRRALLGAAVAGTGAAVAGAVGTPAPASAVPLGTPLMPVLPVLPAQPRGTVLTLLGTSGGPQAEYVRTGVSSVLTVEGHNYLVDAGRSSVTQYLNSGLRLSALSGMFFTHLHADHLADYYNYFLLDGLEQNAEKDRLPTSPIPIVGPGPGWLPPKPPGFPTIAPENPAPGLRDLTLRLNEGYAYHYNAFMRGPTATGDIRDLQTGIKEIVLPPGVGADPGAGIFAPAMAPFVVHHDPWVTVSAVLNLHGSVFPSYAYRFDTAKGFSVVFSGDTRYCQNVITLATGADILVHEVMDLDTIQRGGIDPQLLQHLKDSHTPIPDLASVAQQARVRKLVLNHLIPSNPLYVPDLLWKAKFALAGYRGSVHVGNDRDQIPLPVR